MRRGSLLPGSTARRGSLLPGSAARRGSLLPGRAGRRGSLIPTTDGVYTQRARMTSGDMDTISTTSEIVQIFINTARYQNTTVAVKKLSYQKLHIDRAILVEMKHVS